MELASAGGVGEGTAGSIGGELASGRRKTGFSAWYEESGVDAWPEDLGLNV